MRNVPLRSSFLAALSLTVAAGVPESAAHEYWLSPSAYAARAGQVVELGARVGTGFRGDARRFSAERCVRFVGRTDRSIDLSPAARDGDLVWVRVPLADARGFVAGYESNFVAHEMAPAEFDAYLAEEGLDGPLAARRGAGTAGPGRERYRRCARTWVAGGAWRRAAKRLGLPLEILPQGEPGAGPTLRVRVLLEGRPLEGALVRAWRLPLDPKGRPLAGALRDSTGAVWQGRTDRGGEVTAPVAEPGEWLLATVHMIPSRDPVAADWESTWASFTFARPAGGAARPAGDAGAR
jgi:uncharacterized GH25 family protein